EPTIHADEHDAIALGPALVGLSLQRVDGNVLLRQQRLVAEHDAPAFDDAGHALAGERGEVDAIRKREPALLRAFDDRRRQRVLAAAFDRRSQSRYLVLVEAGSGL